MLEDKLKALMTSAPDAAFTLGVMARIERRQFRRAMIANVVLALAATVLLALTMPVLTTVWRVTVVPGANGTMVAVLLLGAGWLGLRTLRAG
jgi:hypothetical protein